MTQSLYPSLYQINTRVTLGELGRHLGRAATLDDFPDAELDRLARLGFAWVWFLGIWQTGPMARETSRAHPQRRKEFRSQLPDLTDDDIAGSPFAVQAYTPHADFGGKEALVRLRQRLSQRGLRLMLDFVPNHTAPDHPWRFARPEFYVHGDDHLLGAEPHNYTRVSTKNGPAVLARGRDPYFPGWPDTLQLNYRHAGLHSAMTEVLLQIAGLCDGVRCDMAMLVLPEVFARTWGELSRPADGSATADQSFWRQAVPAVRRVRPDFVFMAEVYWDLEWELQQQGFDYTYDKRLYDRLRDHQAVAVRKHLWAEADFQKKSVRFLENHDEPRAADIFPRPVHEAAATVAFLVPGLRFFHDGQLEGRKVKVSMHLGRRRDEPVDEGLREFYARLLEVLRRPEVRDGTWRLRECRPAWSDNSTWAHFLAFTWDAADRRLLAAINYGPTQGQCYISLPLPQLRGRQWRLRDLLHPEHTYDRDGDELATVGLYLDMPPWGHHVFEVSPV